MERLVGHWELVSWTMSVDGSHSGHPFGPDAAGVLVYEPNARMSAQLMRRGRSDASSAEGYFAYAGRWDVVGDEVRHDVEMALRPDWVGTTVVRRITWEGEALVLTTPVERTGRGRAVVQRLTWRRLG